MIFAQLIYRTSLFPLCHQPFRLVTDDPAMTVVQRQSRAITRQDLLAEDEDNTPEEIVFEVTDPPNSGRLSLADDASTAAFTFTQADINAGR